MAIRSNLKRQIKIFAEDLKKYEDEIRKEGIKNELMYGHPDAKPEELLGQVLGKQFPSPHPIIYTLRNPSSLKILKWSSNWTSHELTIVRANGEVMLWLTTKAKCWTYKRTYDIQKPKHDQRIKK